MLLQLAHVPTHPPVVHPRTGDALAAAGVRPNLAQQLQELQLARVGDVEQRRREIQERRQKEEEARAREDAARRAAVVRARWLAVLVALHSRCVLLVLLLVLLLLLLLLLLVLLLLLLLVLLLLPCARRRTGGSIQPLTPSSAACRSTPAAADPGAPHGRAGGRGRGGGAAPPGGRHADQPGRAGRGAAGAGRRQAAAGGAGARWGRGAGLGGAGAVWPGWQLQECVAAPAVLAAAVGAEVPWL